MWSYCVCVDRPQWHHRDASLPWQPGNRQAEGRFLTADLPPVQGFHPANAASCLCCFCHVGMWERNNNFMVQCLQTQLYVNTHRMNEAVTQLFSVFTVKGGGVNIWMEWPQSIFRFLPPAGLHVQPDSHQTGLHTHTVRCWLYRITGIDVGLCS